MLNKLSACAEMSGIPRPAALDKPRKLQSKNRQSQVAPENALVHAVILAAKVPQEDAHNIVLVGRARKMVRKASPRDPSRDLGFLARRAAHASYIGTCKA